MTYSLRRLGLLLTALAMTAGCSQELQSYDDRPDADGSRADDDPEDRADAGAEPEGRQIQPELIPANQSDENVARFAARDSSYRGGEGYYEVIPTSAANRTLAHNLAWGAQHVWESYLSAYRASGNTEWLDRMVREVDRAFAHRDDDMGHEDYRGRIRPLWGTTRYTPNGEYHNAIAHNGYALYQILRLVKLVKEHPELEELYGDRVDFYLEEARVMVDLFDEDWQTGPLPGLGYYRYSPDYPSTSPTLDQGNAQRLNHMNGLGSALILLAGLTDEAIYWERAEAMVRYFHATIKRIPNGSYLWVYHPYRDPSLFSETPIDDWTAEQGQDLHSESIQYAGLNLNFAWEAYRHGIVFTEEDMKAIALTMVENMWQPGPDGEARVAHRMNGKEVGARGDLDLLVLGMRWLVLAEFDERIYDIALAAYEDADKSTNTLISHTTSANLDLWRALLEADE